MTPETIAILAVGASLAVLIWQGQRAAKEDRARIETSLRGELQTGLREAKEDRARIETSLRGELQTGLREAREDRARLEARLQSVEHGQAKLEGLLEGLREAIAGRHAA
ncbi:MAG: hypothetical protein OXN81_19320 [Alphaproteobacteria bacterium]|nr:hypothetical protein [Alphaproteobacteria bacterium]